jgi:hypothetical protein
MRASILAVFGLILIFPRSTPAKMRYFCEEGSVAGLQNCVTLDTSKNKNCEPPSVTGSLRDLEKIVDAPKKLDVCSEKDNAFGTDYEKTNDFKKLQKDLRKECKAKAKDYKKAVLQELINRGKLGRAFKVWLNRKHYRTGVEKSGNDTETIRIDGKSTEFMSDDELNQTVMNEIEKLHPGLMAKAETLLKTKPSFRYGFHENESVPIHVVIQAEGRSCISTLGSLDPVLPFTPQPCQFCGLPLVKNNFVNDCSYMVQKDFPQSKVEPLIGSSAKNRSDFCQKDLSSGHDSDMSDIDNAAKQICSIAQQGLEPDFTIQTSRNLYPDYTPQLAQKRGVFIQKYIRNHLMENCPLASQPEWLTNESTFSNKVKWSAPHYEGAREGDYGPDPYAEKEARPVEIGRLRTTLTKERAELEARIANIGFEISALSTESKSYSKKIDAFYKDYSTLQKSVTKSGPIVKDVGQEIATISEKAEEIVENVEDHVDLRNSTLQRISDLETERKSLNAQLLNHSDAMINRKVSLLEQFYSERDRAGNEPGFREKWDKDLFNDFKMVRISGKAATNPAQMVTNTQMEPKLDLMLNLMTSSESFSCVVEPIDVKSLKLKGYLKGGGQVLMGTLAFSGSLVAAGGVLGMGVFNSALSLLCLGCEKAGKTMPTWRKVGNVFALGDASQRRSFYHRVKHDAHEFITLDGKLEIKARDYRTKEEYNDFRKYAEKYYGDDFGKKSDPNPEVRTEEEKDRSGNVVKKSFYDSNGTLIREIQYNKKGVVLEDQEYNKDGDFIKN